MKHRKKYKKALKDTTLTPFDDSDCINVHDSPASKSYIGVANLIDGILLYMKRKGLQVNIKYSWDDPDK